MAQALHLQLSEKLSPVRSLWAKLTRPIDIATLVYYRIIFAVIMLWEVVRYFSYGWIYEYYIAPSYHFSYLGFSWIRPWPGDGMYIHFAILGVLAFCILIGLFYRACAILFFFAFSYVFLLEQAHYLNHLYLICLLSFLGIFISPHRAFSIDAWRRPEIRSATTPLWSTAIIGAQVGIAYFFGGIAKLNSDWLHGEPMRAWLANRTDFPLIGTYFREEWVVYFFCYGGLLFDLLIIPMILWKKTRIPAFFAAMFFHLMNARLFQIGIFPWFMLASSLLFFSPDWPRRLLAKIRRQPWQPEQHLPFLLKLERKLSIKQKILLSFLGAYFTVQCLLPLRHFLYPGNVSWTEEGHRWAWHMKLRTKTAKVTFYAVDPQTGEKQKINIKPLLTKRQYHKMSSRPYLIQQFAAHLAEKIEQEQGKRVAIHVVARAALNGRKPQMMIDPKVNLAAEREGFFAAEWILPLKAPLPEQKSSKHALETESD